MSITTILQAIKVFSFSTDLNEINADIVKKRYRELVKIHHPDCGGTDEEYCIVRESYDLLMSYIEIKENMDKVNFNNTIIFMRLPLIDIVDILDNEKSIKIKSDDSDIIRELNRYNIRRSHIIIDVDIEIGINGEKFCKKEQVKMNDSNEYSFNFKLSGWKDEGVNDININICSSSSNISVGVCSLTVIINVGRMKFNVHLC